MEKIKAIHLNRMLVEDAKAKRTFLKV